MNRPGHSHAVRSAGSPFLPLWSFALLALAPVGAHAADAPRAIPAQGLGAYVEYNGLAADAQAWQASAAYAVLQRTSAGAMTLEITRQVLDGAFRKLPPGSRPGAGDLLALQEHIIRHGFSAGFYGEDEATGAIVLSALGRNEVRPRLERVLSLVASERPAEFDRIFPRLQGRKVYFLQSRDADTRAEWADLALLFWFEGDDLVGVLGAEDWSSRPPANAPSALAQRVAAVLDTIGGKSTSAATHSSRNLALREGREIRGFEPNGFFFIEASLIREMHSRLTEETDTLTEATPPPAAAPPQVARPLAARFFPPDPASPVVYPLTALEKAEMAPDPAKGRPKSSETLPRPDDLPPAIEDLPSQPVPEPRRVEPNELPPPVADAAPGERNGKPPGFDKEVAKAGLKPGPVADEAESRKAPKTLERILGLDGITRVVGCWGFQGKALLTDVRVEAPAPRRGLLGLLDQPGFSRDRLPALRDEPGAFFIGSLNLARAYDTLMPLAVEILNRRAEKAGQKPNAPRIEDLERRFRDSTGVRLREDLLGHLAPTCSLSSLPPGAAGKTWFNMPVLRVGVDDAGAFATVLDTLASHLNAYFDSLGQDVQGADPKQADVLPLVVLERLPAPARGYRLTSPSKLLVWLGDGLEPTIMVGDSFVLVADTPSRARAAFMTSSQPPRAWKPAGELTGALENLPATLTSLSVGDPRNSAWPQTFSTLPKQIQYALSASQFVKAEGPESAGLAAFGIPRPGGFRLQIDPDRVPSAEAIRTALFPSMAATAVDERGLRLITREALPFACNYFQYGFGYGKPAENRHWITLRPSLFPGIPVYLMLNTTKRRFSLSFGTRRIPTSDTKSKP